MWFFFSLLNLKNKLIKSQRNGIGLLLIKAIITKFIEGNIRSMILWTLQDNPSRLFYKHLGGKIVGRGL